MGKIAITIGPADHGRRMSLDEFDLAEGREGHLYELARGIITVMDVPRPRHLLIVNAIRRQFITYDVAHPGAICVVASGGECKILVSELESERHPDLAIYKTPPPDEGDVWSSWIPEIVVEVVSRGGEERDYVEKRDEYLRFGVLEYWVFDDARRQATILRRSRGDWQERVLAPGEVYRTRLLPGLDFSIEAAFASDR